MWPLPSLRSTVPSAGQEAAPTKVTTPLMRFLTEKHTPKTPKRTPSKKVSTSEDRQGADVCCLLAQAWHPEN